MSIDTKVTPYFDDFDEEKNFQKVLFKPSFPVQARELNQIQTILNKQLERLGNRVLKQGTIVSGCQTVTTPKLPYIKLKNTETDGSAVDVSRYDNKFVKNAANTVGKIITSVSGFTDQDPDLNTIYVRYTSGGNDGTSYTFAPDEVLTVYDGNYPIDEVSINDGSTGFTSNDPIQFIPAARVANTTGGNDFASGLNVGDIVADGNGANVAIATITTDGDDTFLTFEPQSADQIAANTAAWNIEADVTFVNANTSQVFTVEHVFGTGAAGYVDVNGIGEATKVTLTSNGSGYDRLPTVFATSESASLTQLQALDLSAKNFVGKVAVASNSFAPIGNGFGIAIDKGLVYLGGYIVRSDPQFVVVEKYNTEPTDKAVGFEAVESVVTALEDSTLYDNALGAANFSAPGADRLRVTARAVAITGSEAASRKDFLPLVEFSEGQPYQVSEQTESSLIDEHLAVRTFEENGNFVVDPFVLTTKSSDIADSDEQFKIVVDPGVAYIEGYRVATERNYAQSVDKATETKTITETVSSTGYGNYVTCSYVRGHFSFGSQVELRNSSEAVIGKARIKGVKAVNGKFRVYLFDVSMNSGQVFKNVATVTDGNFTATIELIQGSAVLVSPNNSRLIFSTPTNAIKSVDNVSYIYQKANWGTVTANTSGIVSLVTSDADENFPISGTLDVDDASQVLISVEANTVSTDSLTGTISTTASDKLIAGTGTAFLTELAAGQFAQVANNTHSEIIQVESIANNTSLTAVIAPTITIASGTINRAFQRRELITPAAVTVSGDRQTMSIDLGAAIPATAVNVVASVERSPTVNSMTVNRNAVARLNLNTHSDGVVGPWSLGHSNIVRLRGVYKGTNTTFTSSEGVNVTDSFYIDSNHAADFKGIGYLYKKSSSKLSLTAGDRLLVVFDIVAQASSEIATINSYPIDDDVALSESASTLNTLELPEVFGEQYYDVRDAFDFRPAAANTVAIHTTEASAPVNPSEPAYESTYNTFGRVPAPDSEITSTITYYLPRQDRVVASSKGDIKVLKGQAGSGQLPQEPEKSITINALNIPPYPSLPQNLSKEMAEIVNLRTASETLIGRRNARFAVSTTLTDSAIAAEQPRRYTQQDIGSLDRRIDAVEYYLALTAAESQAAARHIGSSNTNINRFKFGFLVDSFSDASQSETAHPEYAATIEDGHVTSKLDRLSIKLSDGIDYGSNGMVSLPYSSQRLVGQMLATNGPVVPPAPEQPAEEVVVQPEPTAPEQPTVTQKTCNRLVTNQNKIVDSLGSSVESANFRFSSLPGTAQVFYNFFGNNFAFEVYQGTTPNFSTSGKTPLKTVLAAEEIPAEQYNRLRFDSTFGFPETAEYIDQYPTYNGSGFIEFEHDPSKGVYYVINVIKLRSEQREYWYSTSSFEPRSRFQYGEFTYEIFYPCDSTSVEESAPFNGVTTFAGTMQLSPGVFTIDYDTTYYKSVRIPGQTFRVTVTGLKPSTMHNVLVEGENNNTNVRPVGKNQGDPVVSSNEGKVEFDLYLPASYSSVDALSSKQVTVESVDETSSALGTITKPVTSAPVVSSVRGSGGHRESSYPRSVTELQLY